MAEPFALGALAIDAAIGWPAPVYRLLAHPVDGFAWMIRACERRWNSPRRPEANRRVLGICTVALLVAVAGGVSILIEHGLRLVMGRWAWIGMALVAAPGLAQRSLYDHVAAVRVALARDDLVGARAAVGMIVGRDTATLDEAAISRAAIESLAESYCDGVAAPLFWLVLLGLPGLWIYKAINTADSLIGHREERWRAFGWAAARSDDVLNAVPARIAAILICLCGGGWRIMARDASKHASPNAGWPEAAMAGALGLRLAGPIAYDGVVQQKPWIGDGRSDSTAADIGRALRIYVAACLCLWLLAWICR